jgi:hypothetical protein
MNKYRIGHSAMFRELRARWPGFHDERGQEDFFYQAWIYLERRSCNHTLKLNYEQLRETQASRLLQSRKTVADQPAKRTWQRAGRKWQN